MRTDKIGRHRIELYNGVGELPSERYAAYNRMLLIDSGVGSDLSAIDNHISAAMKYISAGKKEDAVKVLQNMRLGFYFVLENLSPKHLSYAALVHKIDGKVVTDFSDENLGSMVKQFSAWGADKNFFDRALDQVKKKYKRNWRPTSLKFLRALQIWNTTRK